MKLQLVRSRSEIQVAFFINDPATPEIYTLSLHDALPICSAYKDCRHREKSAPRWSTPRRSEEHTSELQSRFDLVCRLLLEKKKITRIISARNPLAAPPACSAATLASSRLVFTSSTLCSRP